jgi:hypothetical protein
MAAGQRHRAAGVAGGTPILVAGPAERVAVLRVAVLRVAVLRVAVLRVAVFRAGRAWVARPPRP